MRSVCYSTSSKPLNRYEPYKSQHLMLVGIEGKDVDFKKGLADAYRKLAVAHLAKGRPPGIAPPDHPRTVVFPAGKPGRFRLHGCQIVATSSFLQGGNFWDQWDQKIHVMQMQ